MNGPIDRDADKAGQQNGKAPDSWPDKEQAALEVILALRIPVGGKGKDHVKKNRERPKNEHGAQCQ